MNFTYTEGTSVEIVSLLGLIKSFFSLFSFFFSALKLASLRKWIKEEIDMKYKVAIWEKFVWKKYIKQKLNFV